MFPGRQNIDTHNIGVSQEFIHHNLQSAITKVNPNYLCDDASKPMQNGKCGVIINFKI